MWVIQFSEKYDMAAETLNFLTSKTPHSKIPDQLVDFYPDLLIIFDWGIRSMYLFLWFGCCNEFTWNLRDARVGEAKREWNPPSRRLKLNRSGWKPSKFPCAELNVFLNAKLSCWIIRGLNEYGSLIRPHSRNQGCAKLIVWE